VKDGDTGWARIREQNARYWPRLFGVRVPVLQPPFASVHGDPCWSAMLEEPFRENQLIVIEPNPMTPDLQRGFFIGGMNLVTKDGAVSLHEVPLELAIKDF
jgi:hypothetical protein